MGHKAQIDHPDVIAAIKRAEGPILNSDVILGGIATTPEKANQMIERGYRALIVGFHWSLLQRGIEAAIDDVRSSCK